jgi:hypothetical protein
MDPFGTVQRSNRPRTEAPARSQVPANRMVPVRHEVFGLVPIEHSVSKMPDDRTVAAATATDGNPKNGEMQTTDNNPVNLRQSAALRSPTKA